MRAGMRAGGGGVEGGVGIGCACVCMCACYVTNPMWGLIAVQQSLLHDSGHECTACCYHLTHLTACYRHLTCLPLPAIATLLACHCLLPHLTDFAC